MARLEWGANPPGYFAGLDRGVLYVDNLGVAWTGLLSVDEDPGEITESDAYYDGQRYIYTATEETFSGTISAYTYPDEFAPFDANINPQVSPKRFGLCYRVTREDGYDIHILYNVAVVRPNMSYGTETETPQAQAFSWNIQCGDEVPDGWAPTAHIIVSYGPNPDAFQMVEDILYGTDDTDPRLPSPDELIELYDQFATLHIHHFSDGSYTATGPPGWVDDNGDGSFTITAPTVKIHEGGVFSVRSY